MDSLKFLSGGIAPYILGTLLFLSLSAFSLSLWQWREMKQSPYFFQRLQAGKKLQTYSSISLVLFAIAAVVLAYAWTSPTDTSLRVAILTNEKPTSAEIAELFDNDPLVEIVPDAQVNESPIQLLSVANADASERGLPDRYNTLDATAELNPDTAFSPLTFSTEVADDFSAVTPTNIFPEGTYTLFATFDYESMAAGMEWAWVWRHDGAVVGGNNSLWEGGEAGPGYITFEPENGFEAGEYSLEVWVNEELLTVGKVFINDSAVSAGN